MAEGHLHIALT